MTTKSYGNFAEELKELGLDKGNHKFEIIPCPYEKTTTYGKGTDKGPEALIEASLELEYYDDEFAISPYQYGIKTLEPVIEELQDQSCDTVVKQKDKEIFKSSTAFQKLEKVCSDSYARDKFPIVLGGEHSLSVGAIRAAYKRLQAEGKGLTLLHFDAHADLRKEYRGNPYNHACAIYQVYRNCPNIKIVSVGIRNISQGECEWLSDLQKQVSDGIIDEMPISIFYARDEFQKTFGYRSAIKNFKEEVGKDAAKELSAGATHKYWASQDILDVMKQYGNDHFYISFDVDGFDSSLMPSTGTPEPGGLDWYTPTNLIREACKQFNLMGADVVELAPIQGMVGPDFLAAKLVYKIIGSKLISLTSS